MFFGYSLQLRPGNIQPLARVFRLSASRRRPLFEKRQRVFLIGIYFYRVLRCEGFDDVQRIRELRQVAQTEIDQLIIEVVLLFRVLLRPDF